jgi:hypothetical protein
VRLLSVNVGLPREVNWKGKPVTTAIQLLSRDAQQITVSDVTRLYLHDDEGLEEDAPCSAE